jgi:hypothetical protein
VRQRAEDERARLQVRVVMSNETHFLTAEACAFPPSLVRGGEVETKRRMLRDEGTQLTAGVAGRAEDPDRNFMHEE